MSRFRRIIAGPRVRRLLRYAAMVTVIVAVLSTVVFILRPQLFERLERLASGQPEPMLNMAVERSQFPVKGIDVSHHNGVIDFRKVAADSVDFVIIKATEGVTFRDSCMRRNYEGATAAGLRVGFYHFFRFERGGVRQGRNFLGAVGDMPVQMPLVIDFESSNNPETDYYLVVGRLRDMADYLRRHGRRVMVYCNHNDYERYIRGNFDDMDLWLASGRLPEGDDRRHLWQHSHNGRVNGISRPVDINTFNGSRADFEQWVCVVPHYELQAPAAPDTVSCDTVAAH